MPAIKSDPYAAQISSNIFQLTNLSPIPFEIKTIFALFNQPALLRFFEQHQQLGHDIAPFVFAMLVHVAVMLDGVELFNPDGTGFMTSMNLFIHLIGEPGTNKSGLFRTFNNSINVLKKIFPSFFSKLIEETINGKEKETTIDLIANNETELSLYQRLSKRENVFISTDELDVINSRFGVYLAGAVDNDVKTAGARLLCQCYDVIKNVSRTTGSSSFYIERGSINIFGASTGNMLSSICRQYNSDVQSDGIISRYLFITTSAHKPSNQLPREILSVQPNIVHILIVIRLLAQYKPIFVFGEYSSQNNLLAPVNVPVDIEEARRNISNPIPVTEQMSVLKPSVVVNMEKIDEEQDDSILSPYDAIRRIIEFEYQKSTQVDMNGIPINTPLQRAFQRKSSNKLARLAGLCQAMSYAINLCTECINMVRFGDGLHLKERLDNEQLNWLQQFHDTVKQLIKRDIEKLPKYGSDKRPLFVIEKAAVHAAESLYQYCDATAVALFSDTPLKAIKQPTKVYDNSTNNIQLSKDEFFEEQAILLKMTSPILVTAWFSNSITGLPFTNFFKQYRKTTEKTLKLTHAIDQLVNNGILQKGVKDTRHIVTARKETYLKTSPFTIRRNAHMLNYLQSIGVNIDTYEHSYLSSPLPMKMELTKYTVDLILSDNDYLEFSHLFNDIHIQQQMEERLSKNEVLYRMSFGRKQYHLPSSSQMTEQDHNRIANRETHFIQEQQQNSNSSPTLAQSTHRSAINVSPLTRSSNSENASLFSEIHHLTINSPLANNELVHQSVAAVGVENDFESENLSTIDETLSQLYSMIGVQLSNTNDSTLVPETIETIADEPVSHQLNSCSTQSEVENINLSSNDIINDNNDNIFPCNQTVPYDITTILNNVNSQQTYKLISELVRNKKDLVKRIFEQENDDITSKRSRNNENQDASIPNFVFNINSSESLSTVSTETEPRIDDHQIEESDNHASTPNEYPTSSTPNEYPTSSTPKNDTNLASFSTTNTTSTSMSDTSSFFQTVDKLIESTGQEVDAIDQSTNVNNQEQTSDGEQHVDHTKLLEAYEKIILSNSVVMTKSEICMKLKHIEGISKLRDNIISTLVKDKLLIEGKWFAVKRANGIISLMLGYLKAFPKDDDIQDQQSFARSLTKYGIHYHDFEQSFKRKKNDSFPRTLDASDVKFNNKWLFSTELMNVIEKNSFLHERIVVDPSAIIQENVSSTISKRVRKPKQRYSPSDNN